MPDLPKTEVTFRPKEVRNDWLAPYIDTLLLMFMGVDQSILRGALARELRYYDKAMSQAEFSDDAFAVFRAFLRGNDYVPDLRAFFTTLKSTYELVGYTPDRDVAVELSMLLDDRLHNEWRETKSDKCALSETEVALMFRLSVWTIRELEKIAVKVIAIHPNDFGLRNLLNFVRGLAYGQAQELASVARNASRFSLELGCESFCPDNAVTGFWDELGVAFVKPRNVHPVDEELNTAPKFMDVLSTLDEALSRQSRGSALTIADRASTLDFVAELKFLQSVWRKVLCDYFHLGPTSALLKRTSAALNNCQTWLDTEKEKVKDKGKFFVGEFQSVVEAFEKAQRTLVETLDKRAA